MRKIMVSLAAAAVLLTGCSSTSSSTSSPASTANASNSNAAAADKGVTLYPGAAKADAPDVVLFTDFQCPGCASLEEAYGSELDKLAKNGDIKLRMVSLTFLDGMLHNDSSSKAAAAAACTVEIGKYPEAFRAIYANQPAQEGQGFTDTFLRDQLPKSIGMNDAQTSTYQSCVDSKAKLEYAKTVYESGKKELYNAAGRVSTPTIVVNGTPFDTKKYPQNPADLLAALKSTT